MKRTLITNCYALVTLIIVSLIVFGCQKNEVATTINNDVTDVIDRPFYDYPAGKLVKTSITGLITDETGMPIADATVSVYGHETTTNTHGAFLFQNIRAFDERCYIMAEKDGYLLGSRTINIEQNGAHAVQIGLIPRTKVGDIDNAAGGEITMNSGCKIKFPANSVSYADGKAYNGTVEVYAHYLNPMDENLPITMPGDLTAVNANGQFNGLESHGMLNVELKSPVGEELQIANGSQVGLEIPMPTDILAAAVQTIPMWHFDEKNGIWVEEGEATFNGSSYETAVKHFTWWNWDIPILTTKLEIIVKDIAGLPLEDVYVCLSRLDPASGTPYSKSCRTVSFSGIISGLVPRNEEILVSIEQKYFCYGQHTGTTYNIVSPSSNILGPYANSASNTVTLECEKIITQSNDVIVEGRLFDCENAAYNSGNVWLEAGVRMYGTTDNQGNFTFTIDANPCRTIPDAASLTVFDRNGKHLQTIEGLDISAGGTIDLGQLITICDPTEEYIKTDLPFPIHYEGPDYPRNESNQFGGKTWAWFTHKGRTEEVLITAFTEEAGLDIPGEIKIKNNISNDSIIYNVTIDVYTCGEERRGTFGGTFKENSGLFDGTFNIFRDWD